MQKGRRKIKGKKPKKNHLCTSCSLKKKEKRKKPTFPFTFPTSHLSIHHHHHLKHISLLANNSNNNGKRPLSTTQTFVFLY
jgi:hypothetical protein